MGAKRPQRYGAACPKKERSLRKKLAPLLYMNLVQKKKKKKSCLH
jgi:hypothetical protein